MAIQLSRRSFLRSLAMLPIATVAKSTSQASTDTTLADAAEIIASAPDVPMWAAGTPGEFDWRAIAAESGEQAFAKWCDEMGFPADARPAFTARSVLRVPSWDGKAPSQVNPSDWIEGGLGHHCDRCDGEVGSHEASVIEGDVVCHECMTFGERIAENEDRGLEDLVALIVEEGEDEARAYIVQHEDFDMIPPEVWTRAVNEAILLV